jgi:hypothetical protein
VKQHLCHYFKFIIPRLSAGLFLVQNALVAGAELQEKYTYEAVPEGGKASQHERIEAVLIHSGERIFTTLKTDRPGSEEIIQIETTPDGTFVSGSRRITYGNNANPDLVEIVRKQKTVRVTHMKKGKRKIKEYDLTEEDPLAVDISLLILLRFFPFDQAVTWHLFLMDFSRHSVSIDVCQKAIEKVAVPAGEFECYRMEVTLKIFIFRPRMIYWITKEKPHFLVKHVGKRGPLSPKYTTFLISVD